MDTDDLSNEAYKGIPGLATDKVGEKVGERVGEKVGEKLTDHQKSMYFCKRNSKRNSLMLQMLPIKKKLNLAKKRSTLFRH